MLKASVQHFTHGQNRCTEVVNFASVRGEVLTSTCDWKAAQAEVAQTSVIPLSIRSV